MGAIKGWGDLGSKLAKDIAAWVLELPQDTYWRDIAEAAHHLAVVQRSPNWRYVTHYDSGTTIWEQGKGETRITKSVPRLRRFHGERYPQEPDPNPQFETSL